MELVRNGHRVEVISLLPEVFNTKHSSLLKNIDVIYPSSNPLSYLVSSFYCIFSGKSVLFSAENYKTSIKFLGNKNLLKSLFNFLIIDNLVYKIIKNKVEIKHIHTHHLFLSTYCTYQISKKINASYSITLHTLSYFYQDSILKKILNRAVFLRAISSEIAPHYNKYINNSGKFHFITNGVNGDEFNFNPVKETNNGFMIIAVGALLDKKGFDLIIQACSELKSNNFSFTCEIYGEGKEKEFLQTIINELNLDKEVKLMGHKPVAEVTKRMKQSGCLIMPSRNPKRSTRDGLPTVIIEAMACKLPVISTAFAGIPDIVVHRHTGLIVPQEDYKEIANAVILLAYDNNLREKIINEAFENVKNNYSLTKSVNMLERLFLKEQGKHES